MIAVTYDFIKKLEQAGFTPPQVEILSTFTTETVNKPEMMQIEKDLSNKIDASEIKLETKLDKSVGGLNIKIEKLEIRMEGLETRMTGVEKRMDRLEEKMERGFDKLYSAMKWFAGTIITLIPTLNILTFHFAR